MKVNWRNVALLTMLGVAIVSISLFTDVWLWVIVLFAFAIGAIMGIVAPIFRR